jgi:phosphatidyl-myo-inositol dimannoside synthase
LSGREKYKGYDMVINCLPSLLINFPSIRYIIAGKYDDEEKGRIDRLIKEKGLEKHVILTGYLKEDMLTDYYQMADLFIMPSRKEGFGIVFLEAMVSGLPVIGGNMDGSVDALRNGELGILVDPTSIDSISEGISSALQLLPGRTENDSRILQEKVLSHFGYPEYKKRLADLINSN